MLVPVYSWSLLVCLSPPSCPGLHSDQVWESQLSFQSLLLLSPLFRGVSSPASDPPCDSGTSQTASLVPSACSPPSQCPVSLLWLSIHRRGRNCKSHPQAPRPSLVCCMARRIYLGCLGLSIFFIAERETVCRPGQSNLIKSLINSLAEAGGNLRRPGHKGEPGICSDCTEQRQLSARGHQVGKAIWTSLLLAATCRELQMGVGVAEPRRGSLSMGTSASSRVA